MIATSFIEQTWLFSTLLVVVAFAAAFQLLASDKQSLSAIIRIGLFVASGLLLIISAWIDMWLAMILGPWRTVQDQRIPEEVIRITNGLANVSVYPFFVGILSFFSGMAATGFVHSGKAGWIVAVAVVFTLILMVVIWLIASPALRTS